MLFPESLLEEIKSRFDLVQFVSRYVDLKRAGAGFKGLCPFHQEKTPSFTVTPARGIFKCFGCQKGGNLITFLQYAESISFPEAVRMLAQEAGVDISRYQKAGAEQDRSENDKLFKINDEARAFFRDALSAPGADAARVYARKRALEEATIDLFSLGYAPAAWDTLTRHLAAKGFEEEAAIKAGLLIRRDNGSVIDKFRNRLMVPLFNLSGLTCGFTGRVLDDNDQPKYLNSPETPVFQKGKILYGLPQSREPIRAEKHAILVEGNVDLLTLFQGGVQNVAATSGTALTDSQALLLKRFCDRVTLVYDGDNAGRNASVRGITVLINAGLTVRVAALPLGQDPDSYFKKEGRDAFLALTGKASDIVDFVMDAFALNHDLSIPENKSKLVGELLPILSAVTEPVLKAEYLHKAALRTGLREETILSKRGPVIRQVRKAESQEPGALGAAAGGPDNRIEDRLLQLLVCGGERHLSTAKNYLAPEALENLSHRALYAAFMSQNGVVEVLYDRLEGLDRELLDRLLGLPREEADEIAAEEEFRALILKLRANRIKRKRAEVKRRLALPGADMDALLREFNVLTVELNGLKTE